MCRCMTSAQPRNMVAFATPTADPWRASSGRTALTDSCTFCGSAATHLGFLIDYIDFGRPVVIAIKTYSPQKLGSLVFDALRVVENAFAVSPVAHDITNSRLESN